MEAYHCRSYTLLLVLDLFIDAEARLRDVCKKLTLSFLFLVQVSSWLKTDIIIDSIFLENCSNARDVLLLALSPEYATLFGIFASYKRP